MKPSLLLLRISLGKFSLFSLRDGEFGEGGTDIRDRGIGDGEIREGGYGEGESGCREKGCGDKGCGEKWC
jgi:hypothetical protein